MTATTDPFGPVPASGDFVITHMIDAPRDLVWAAYTRPEHLSQWWGPQGLKMLATDVDLWPGGLFRYGMEAPNGATMWGRWIYRSIAAPKRMVVVVSFTNESGEPIRHPMEPNWPLGMLSSMTLEEQGNRTMLTVIARPDGGTGEERQVFEAGRDSMKQGFSGTFATLDRYLAKLQGGTTNVRLVQRVTAPPEDVFRAWTDPQLLASWWGPQHFTNPVCTVDPRPGGTVSIVMRAPDGTDYPMQGEFAAFEPPAQLVLTARALDSGGRTLLETRAAVRFAPLADGTEVTVVAEGTPRVPEAHAMVAGMQEGWRQSVVRLAALFARG
jgi:uncharacterized protein YndB with AHSA1/START domain